MRATAATSRESSGSTSPAIESIGFGTPPRVPVAGADEDNLSLSDRRAESVAVALTQQFGVPAENLTTQGYGEQYLKVPTQGPEQQNRRVTLRRITPLLAGQS